MIVVVNVMVVKSLIYGTATGIAVAAFSGKGEGYDGFTPAYFATFGLAVGANIAYWLGRPADGLPAVRQRARPDLGLRRSWPPWSSRSG